MEGDEAILDLVKEKERRRKLREAGFTEEDVELLYEEGNLVKVLLFLRDEAEIKLKPILRVRGEAQIMRCVL